MGTVIGPEAGVFPAERQLRSSGFLAPPNASDTNSDAAF